jgi:Secretion system C-terminal sorting domain
VINDTLSDETLKDFGTVIYAGLRIPKGIISTGQGSRFVDYVMGDQTLDKQPAGQLIHYSSDWSKDRTMVAAKSQTPNRYDFEYSDTLLQYSGFLQADQYLKPHFFQAQDTFVLASGVFKGNLKLDTNAIVQSEHLSIFYLKYTRNGVPVAFQMVEKIDTNTGVYFSELKSGTLLVACGYKQGAVIINNTPKALNAPQGSIIAQLGGNAPKVVAQIQAATLPTIKGLVYSNDTTQIGLLLQGTDTLWQTSNGIAQGSNNGLVVAGITSQGVVKWSRKLPLNTLETSKMALSNGANKGLFVGLTYRDSLKIGQHRFISQGGSDVSILKFDTMGAIIQHEAIGSAGDETVSKMMESAFYLFLGGDLKGNVSNRTLGLMDYVNQTSSYDRAYISAVYDTVGTRIEVADSNLVETIESKLNLSAQVSKKQPTAIDPSPKQVFILAFPNPFQDELTLQFQAPQNSKWTLRIMDNLGAVVKQIGQDVSSGFNSVKLSTSTLQPGIYFLQCINAEGYLLQTLKVVKM